MATANGYDSGNCTDDNNGGNDIEDVFDQSQEAEAAESNRRFDNYTAGFFKAGFREALGDDQSNEVTLQSSFDEGYRTGFGLSKAFASLRYSLNLIEGMYADGRLIFDSRAKLEALKGFNEKLNKLHRELSVLMNNKDWCRTSEFDVEIMNELLCNKVDKLINLKELKREADKILKGLRCPVNVASMAIRY